MFRNLLCTDHLKDKAFEDRSIDSMGPRCIFKDIYEQTIASYFLPTNVH